MDEVHITVITPSLNQKEFLEAAMDSVLGQNYPHLHYGVVDGQSTDGSRGIIQRHAKHLEFWMSEKDSGQAHALNKGFALAGAHRHHLFAYLNSDDLYTGGTLARVADAYRAARGRAGADGREGMRCWLVGDVENFGPGIASFTSIYPEERTPEDRFFWFYANPVHQPGAFWSADLFARFGPFDASLRYVFDYDFFMRLRFFAGVRPIHIGETLARFRLHEASKTVRERALFEPEFQRVREEIAEELTARERQEARKYVRRTHADRLQAAALNHIRRGNRRAAFSELAQSLWHDPRLVWQRRTAGAVKRLLRRSRAETRMSHDQRPGTSE